MSLYIDDKRLIPAPFVNINKEILFSTDGRPIQSVFRITLNGTLLPNKGSPTSTEWFVGVGEPADEEFTTDDQKFQSLLNKQDLLRETLSSPGFHLTYQPDGFTAVDCYPKLRSISFQPGTWVIKSDYSIELEANTLNKEGTDVSEDTILVDATGLFLSAVSDNFDIKEREDGSRVYEVTRTVSATANTAWGSGGIIGTEAWQNAKRWVDSRLVKYPIHSNNIFSLPTGISSTGYYNFVNDEVVDKLSGTYTRSQRYISRYINVIEQRNISRVIEPSRLGDFSPTVEKITVNGRIEGLSNTNDPSGKLASAIAYWNSIKAGLPALVGAYGSTGVTASTDEDYFNGTLNYSIQFVNNSGTTYKHNYDVSFNYSDGSLPQVTIAGQIEGVTPDDFYGPNDNKFNRAVSGWSSVKGSLKTLAFAYTAGGQIFGLTNYANSFGDYPINKSVSFNKPVGSINYSFTYGFISGTGTSQYIDEYQVELNTQNAATDIVGGYGVSATVNGTVRGLTNTDDPTEKNANANIGWSAVQSLLFTRVNNESSKIGGTTPGLVNRTISRSVSVNRVAGSIGYSATYSNAAAPSDSNVAVADVSIEETFPQDIVAIQIIPGRNIGPIIQNIGTKNEQRRNINVALTLYPKSGGNYWGISDRPTIRTIASGYFASGVVDLGARGTGWFLAGQSENWDWKNGLYTGSLSVILASGI